jgi:hypothetical protein
MSSAAKCSFVKWFSITKWLNIERFKKVMLIGMPYPKMVSSQIILFVKFLT